MNKANLKAYAPQARKDFIAAVTARANQLGLTATKGELAVAPATRQGDVTLIEGREWSANVYTQRENLIKRIQREGFEQVIEAVAYTWFNRFAALRYMELHDYLGHGYRVLSSTAEGSGAHTPDMLLHAVDLAQSKALPGLKADTIAQLKLAGNQDAELYRRLLIAQCNALSNAMPFLFERIDDESELLLPDNLLRTDSIIAKLVNDIPEEDWQQVEIVGWLYQFYISEKKDQVIGKVVKSQDIPAATQLFTPNWIVQYLVQNSVGRLWMMANPQSALKSQWPYYIESAEQTAEVNAQLDALIQTRMAEDGGSLNPESITVLDPACGSGHILVEAYELLKGIYLERGYRLRDIPRLILEKNLYGLDIDDRAAQLAGFALMMKARADDRRLLDSPITLNIHALQESKGMDLDEFTAHLQPFGISRSVLCSLLDTFEHAKTFGSLIQIPQILNEGFKTLADGVSKAIQSGDVFAQAAAKDLLPLLMQTSVLAKQFDAVVANPPYMGGKYLTPILKAFLKDRYKGFDKDLFAAFTLRNAKFGKSGAEIAAMTSNVWMFISSYEEMRTWLIRDNSLNTLVQLSNSGFDGATVFVCAFTFTNQYTGNHTGSFIRLVEFSRPSEQGPRTLDAIHDKNCGWYYTAKPYDFKKIPGSPIAYWISDRARDNYSKCKLLGDISQPRQGMATTNNKRYLRLWHEVAFSGIAFGCANAVEGNGKGKNWFPYNKGGDFRKWYGNNEFVVLYEQDGSLLIDMVREKYPRISDPEFVIKNRKYYFKPSVTWSYISSSYFGVRVSDKGFIFDVAGSSIFPEEMDRLWIAALMISKVSSYYLNAINPTLNFQVENISAIPVLNEQLETNKLKLSKLAESAVCIARNDWNADEKSWDFMTNPLVQSSRNSFSLGSAWLAWQSATSENITKLKCLEEENNRIVIAVYGLNDEIPPEVPEDQITLARADREKDCQRLISYAIGCMMGRYSLDDPGLIYADAGNVGFDTSRYKKFPADADGIVPITDELWFEDDAANRVREFLNVVWGSETLDENLAWLAESLGTKGSETPMETIRRYISGSFFKDHLQTYKKRPIYWHFSSGKQGAFQALVYLHRYNEGTLARMRAEYVVPLTGKMQTRIDMLEKDKDAASSTAARYKIAKQIESLKKKHVELLAYDEKLRHYADMRISLDLDDGVKVNYAKFGDLLAEVKAVTGGASDD